MTGFYLNTVTLAVRTTHSFALGWLLCGAIILIVVGVVEIHKLKKTVRELGRRIVCSNRAMAGALRPRPRSRRRRGRPCRRWLRAAGPSRPRAVTPPVRRPSVVPEPRRPRARQHAAAFAPVKPSPPPLPVPRVSKPIDWEAFFGVKLLAWIGGFVLFLGIVFLVKYSSKTT